MTKCIEGCCEVLLLVGVREKNNGTSHVDNRVIKASMGYSTANLLRKVDFPYSDFPFPSRYVHPSQRYIFLGNWPKISWPKKVQLRRREAAETQNTTNAQLGKKINGATGRVKYLFSCWGYGVS
jgi:hypothetical protein